MECEFSHFGMTAAQLFEAHLTSSGAMDLPGNGLHAGLDPR